MTSSGVFRLRTVLLLSDVAYGEAFPHCLAGSDTSWLIMCTSFCIFNNALESNNRCYVFLPQHGSRTLNIATIMNQVEILALQECINTAHVGSTALTTETRVKS
jgi:hypothetical protein